MNGLAFLDKLMRLHPIPVVMVSTLTTKGASETLLALELGAVDFGPVILTGIYRLPQKHRVRPHVGAGATHIFILGNHDAAITQLKVHDNWGFVLEAGFEFHLTRSWALFEDYKRLWLHVNAEGLLGNAPRRAGVTLDPDLVSAGLKFHFS